jgi:hypothetical protein
MIIRILSRALPVLRYVSPTAYVWGCMRLIEYVEARMPRDELIKLIRARRNKLKYKT